MPKNVLHDVMTKEQRSIRHVPLPHHRGKREEVAEEDILYEREEIEIEESSPSSFFSRRFFLWAATLIFLILLGVALATSFTGATITVTPKTEVIELDHEFVASMDTKGKLGFEALPISETLEAMIPADTTKKVVEKASGTILIYNTFSDKPQRLIKNTRFETRDGLIYRIGNSVTIPGKTIKNGKTIPGSAEALVSADAAGSEYNIPLSDFTVPGFKGDSARFAGFYARSKTTMTGGFDGEVKVPSDAAIKAARIPLREKLAAQVSKVEQKEVPAGYVIFDGASKFVNESLPPEERKDGLSAVKERTTGAFYLFKESDISQAIAAAAVQGFTIGAPVTIPDIRTLKLELKDPGANPSEAKVLRFTLTGKVRIVWSYDAEKLKTALLGKPKDDLAATLSSFPTIEKADLVLRPFWSGSFPDDPRKFSIEDANGQSK